MTGFFLKAIMCLALFAPGVVSGARTFGGKGDCCRDSKVVRIVKHEIRKVNKWAKRVEKDKKSIAGAPMARFIKMDSLVLNIARYPCVVDALWDRCIKKPAIFPGHSTVGLIIKGKKGVR